MLGIAGKAGKGTFSGCAGDAALVGTTGGVNVGGSASVSVVVSTFPEGLPDPASCPG